MHNTTHFTRKLAKGLSCCLLPMLFLMALPAWSQIFSGEPVQWVGRPNGYSTTPYNSDYRTLGYRRVSVNSGTPTDGRGQWATTINVQSSGGNIAPDNMPGGGGAGWLLISGPSGNRFQNKWNFNGVAQATLNVINNVTLQTGGNDMGLNMGTTGYYTFVFRDAGYANSQVYIAYTQNAPVQPQVTGQSFNPLTYGSVISISTNANPSSGENIYVRYRAGSNDFSTGTSLVQASGSGTSWSAEIPQQSCGSTVYYYVFTSTRSLNDLNSSSEQERSLSAIRYDDLFGANRSYQVSPTPTAGITNNSGTTQLTCNQTSISVTATGGVSYSWSGGLGNSANALITSPGTYTVTVTGSNGCTATANISITQDITTPNAQIINNSGTTVLTCSQSTITLTPTGGISQVWTAGGSGAGSLTLSTPGTYTATATGANGCTASASVVITQDITPPTAGITNNSGTTILTCNQTSISVTATGGVSYSWSGGLGNSANASITSPGTYTVTVTGSNGCTATANISITQDITTPNAQIINNSGTTVLTCSQTTITLTPTGGISQVWTAGGSGAGSLTLSTPGTYTATATGANGCTASASVVITQDITPPAAGITNNSGTTILTCNQASISVTATGGVSYSWSGSLGNSANASITSPGTYTVTVTGSNGCTATANISITQDITAPNAQIINNSGTTVLTCSQTTITLTPTGGISQVWTAGGSGAGSLTLSTPGTYTATATGANGCTASASVVITQDITPPAAGITNNSGTALLTCTQTSISVTATGGVSYSWSGGLGNNANASITSPGTYTVTVTGSNGCVSTSSISITQNISVPGPTTVSGATNVCPFVGNGTQVAYTASAPGATSYNWILPPNVNLVSGQGTANLIVTFNNGFTSQANKQLRVVASNSCGSNAQVIYYLLAQNPGTPAPIVASSNNVCPSLGTNVPITFTIPKTPGAASYIWSAQPGTTTISSVNGPGANDTSVTVTFSSGFTTSAITVQAVNSCGVSGTRSLTITRNNPATPGLISGPTNVCAYIAPGPTATYSVAVQPAVTNYIWTLPAGATNISYSGATNNQVSFNYPTGYSGGTISVVGTNGCGTSTTPRSLAVATLSPATPSVIDVINTVTCADPGPDRVYTYSLSDMPANATSVQWTIPAAGTITSGQGTASITVSYPPTSVVGTVTATAVNNCGSSTVRSVDVKLPACPPEFAAGNGNTFMRGNNMLSTAPDFSVQLFPNPAVSEFTLRLNSFDKNSQVTVRILDLQGREMKRMILMPDALKTFGSELKAGAYMIEVLQGNNRTVQKLIKL